MFYWKRSSFKLQKYSNDDYLWLKMIVGMEEKSEELRISPFKSERNEGITREGMTD